MINVYACLPDLLLRETLIKGNVIRFYDFVSSTSQLLSQYLIGCSNNSACIHNRYLLSISDHWPSSLSPTPISSFNSGVHIADGNSPLSPLRKQKVCPLPLGLCVMEHKKNETESEQMGRWHTGCFITLLLTTQWSPVWLCKVTSYCGLKLAYILYIYIYIYIHIHTVLAE